MLIFPTIVCVVLDRNAPIDIYSILTPHITPPIADVPPPLKSYVQFFLVRCTKKKLVQSQMYKEGINNHTYFLANK